MLALDERPPLAFLATGADGAALRALMILMPITPAIASLIFEPQTGVLSDSFAGGAWFGGPLFTALGFAASVVLETLMLGYIQGLIALPIATAVFLTTINQGTLRENGKDFEIYCHIHSALVGLLMIAVLIGLKTRGASWIVVIIAAALMLGIAVTYLITVNGEDFDATADGTKEALAAVGTMELIVFMGERSIVSALPVRSRVVSLDG